MGTKFNVDASTGDLTTVGSIVSTSTTSGFLLPKLTTTQRDAIVSPATGLEIFNTTTNQSEFYNGSTWIAVGGVTPPAGSNTQIQFNNSGAFGASSSLTWNGTVVTVGGTNSVTAISTVGDIAGWNFHTGGTGGGSGGNINVRGVVNFIDTTSSSVSIQAPTTYSSGGYTLKLPVAQGAASTFLQNDGSGNLTWAAGGGGGSVSSVAMTVPAFLSVAGSPVTSSGTLAVSFSGTALPVANGGTGLTTITAHDVLIGNGTSAITPITPSTSGFVLVSNGTGSDPAFKPVGIGNVGSITGTGTVTPDAATANTFATTVTGTLTLNGPTNGIDGQKITFRLLQDGTGHTVSFSTGSGNFRFSTDLPSYSASGANLTDYIAAIYNSAATRWDIVSIIQGF